MNLTETDVALILAALLALSEALSLIPSIKSNGILQAIINLLKMMTRKKID